MIVHRRSTRLVVGVLPAILFTACAGHRQVDSTPVAMATVLTASKQELLDRLTQIGTGATAWTGTADLTVDDRNSGSSRQVKLRIAGRKPSELRMQGTKTLLPTLFVLVANDAGLWLDVPSRKTTYLLPPGATPRRKSAVANSLLAFRSADLLRAIVPDAPEMDEVWSLIEEPQSYTLTAHQMTDAGLTTTRRCRFERAHLDLVDLSLYDAAGRVVSLTRYVWGADDSPVPAEARVDHPFERMTLAFSFDEVQRAELSDRVFEFQVPAGRELVDVSVTDVAIPSAAPAAEDTADGTVH